MQTEAIATTTNFPSIETPNASPATTQDGSHLPAPSSLDGGGSSSRSRSLSPRDGAVQHDDISRLLSDGEQFAFLPGERISAYENAITPTAQQTMGFKVVKRSGSVSDGPTLTDCPNGTSLQKRRH